MQNLPVEIIHHVEGPEPAATGQCIDHEVYRPDRVGQSWCIQAGPFALGNAFAGRTAQVQVHSLVNPIDTFVVPLRVRLARQPAALPESPRGVLTGLFGQRLDQIGIVLTPVCRGSVPGSPGQPHTRAGPAQRPFVFLNEETHRLALLLRPYNFFAIKSFMATLSSASSAYIRLSLAFSASRSLTRARSEASMPP